MEIRLISKEDIVNVVRGGGKNNYIFGASDLGKSLLQLLMEKGVTVRGIWDNDVLKQGKSISGVPIISYDQLKKDNNFNLFLGCNYAMQEEKRIDALSHVTVYRVGCTEAEIEKQFMPFKDKFPKFIEESEKVRKLYEDELSCKVSDAIIDYIVNCNGQATQKVVSREDHYLVKEVREHLLPDAVFVDLGAFTGEFPAALMKNNISFKKCFCFEMEEANMGVAIANMKKLGIEDKVEMIPEGVSEEEGYLYFERKGANSKIVDYETENKVKITTIDAYFSDIKIDFVKMDIEGAEMGALKGGINVIKRDRPILAISVYHSLEDRVEIPRYLYEQLTNYDFYLRQHSIWAAETVLYAIPKEG